MIPEAGLGGAQEKGHVEVRRVGGEALGDQDQGVMTIRGAAKEIAFGSIAGIVAEVFEYPFDLAKVRLQSQLLSPSGATSATEVVKFKGPLDCLIRTWHEEGIRGLYRGLPAPIVGSMAETASLFLTYSAFQNVIRYHNQTYESNKAQPLSIPQLGLAAAGAGFVTSFILTPIELIKCKMQVQMMNTPLHTKTRALTTPLASMANPGMISSSSKAHSRLYSFIAHNQKHIPSPSSYVSKTGYHPAQSPKHRSHSHHSAAALSKSRTVSAVALAAELPGPIQLVRSVVRSHGLKGLWVGHTGTLFRETGGTAVWFTVKEWIGNLLIQRRKQSPNVGVGLAGGISLGLGGAALGSSLRGGDLVEDIRIEKAGSEILSPWESAVAGAISGAVCVLALYPADTIKSIMQTQEEMTSSSRATASKLRALTQSKSFWQVTKETYRMHGLRGLYAGCGMTVLRAVPTSGIIFVVYDGLSAYFA
ncbi:hypothetical protein AX16_007204 [Volvariella volvacea WC 439]|nr:hypothetical protein AX16_007204 [Volvariella volvacea WC 439]